MKNIFQLLMLIMTSFNVFGQISYSGFIGKYPIEFVRPSDFFQDDCYYFYSKHNETIKLTGERFVVNSSYYSKKVVFFEKDKNGKNTAKFTFENFDTESNHIEGYWTDLISKKQLEVKLLKNKPEKINKNDSIIIKNHLRKLEVEALVDQYTTVENIPKPKYDLIVKKILTVDEKKYEDYEGYKREIIKILFENKVTDELYPVKDGDNRGLYWGNGNVYYSPDKTFKVFVFEGESCGAYCNPEYDSFIQLKSGKIISGDTNNDNGINGIGFTPIISLFKTGTNTYGSIETTWGGGNTGRVYYTFSQFSIINDTIITSPLKNGSFGIDSHRLLETTYMKYNSTSKKILFHYERMKYELFDAEDILDSDRELANKIPKQLLPLNDGEILMVRGEFEIENGKIANYKEWYEKRKENSDGT